MINVIDNFLDADIYKTVYNKLSSNEFAEKMGIRAKKADTGAAGGPQPITK